MRYPKPNDNYSCEVLCENFMEIEQKLEKLGDGGSGSGKSAYQYAVDGGYVGTEEEFTKKLAEETYTKTESDNKYAAVKTVENIVSGSTVVGKAQEASNAGLLGGRSASEFMLKTESPDAPVQSVNGKTGAVVLNASDVGAATSAEVSSLKSDLAKKVDEVDLETEVVNQLDGAKADIVAELIEQIRGMPVFGTVDGDNKITVTSVLSDGDYVLVYENEEGTIATLCEFTVGNGEATVTFTNLANTTPTTDTTITTASEGWLENVRINSSNAITSAPDNHITNRIIIGDANVLRCRGIDAYGGYGRIYYYNGTSYVGVTQPTESNASTNFVSISDTGFEMLVSRLKEIASANGVSSFDSVRIGGSLTSTKENVIVTLDEEIPE